MFAKKKRNPMEDIHMLIIFVHCRHTYFLGFHMPNYYCYYFFFSNRDRNALNAWGLKGS